MRKSQIDTYRLSFKPLFVARSDLRRGDHKGSGLFYVYSVTVLLSIRYVR